MRVQTQNDRSQKALMVGPRRGDWDEALEARGYAIHHAPTFAMAKALLREDEAPQLITVEWRDKETIDFVEYAQTEAPGVGVLVLSSRASARDYKLALAAGAVDVVGFKVPLDDLDVLLKAVVDRRGGAKATVDGLSVSDVLQALHQNQRTTCIEVGLHARIYMQSGEVIHATSNELSGLPAFIEIVSRTGGAVQTTPFRSSDRTINRAFHHLLLDALAVADENAEAVRRGQADVDDELDFAFAESTGDEVFAATSHPPAVVEPSPDSALEPSEPASSPIDVDEPARGRRLWPLLLVLLLGGGLAVWFLTQSADQDVQASSAGSVVPKSGLMLTNSAQPNSASPDSASPDSASPDSASPDSASPDSASPDSASPDSASPDSASPDSASPDSASPDSAPSIAQPGGGKATVVKSEPPVPARRPAPRRRWSKPKKAPNGIAAPPASPPSVLEVPSAPPSVPASDESRLRLRPLDVSRPAIAPLD